MKFLNLFIAIFIISFPAFANEKLIFAIDLIRHGDRAPIREIPKAPYSWKTGLGELTPEGIQQEIQLGEALRKKYVEQDHLLPPLYDAKTIYVRSTESNRALMSADKVLLGLYPLNTRESANTVIPIVAYIHKEDTLLATKPNNNFFFIMYRYYKDKQLWKEKTAHVKEKLQVWSKITGLSLKNFQQIAQLSDVLYIRKLHHIPLPNGISEEDADQIISLGNDGIINRFKLTNVTNAMGQEFIKNVGHNFDLAIKGQTSLKYILLSGHDSTIMSVLNTLHFPIEEIPAYGSRLNFSLFENGNDYYVRIYYNDKPLYIDACGNHQCSLTQLFTLI